MANLKVQAARRRPIEHVVATTAVTVCVTVCNGDTVFLGVLSHASLALHPCFFSNKTKINTFKLSSWLVSPRNARAIGGYCR